MAAVVAVGNQEVQTVDAAVVLLDSLVDIHISDRLRWDSCLGIDYAVL